ncbi:hypothetical protein EV182_003046, partial [Spiromyces aspiralis]
MAAGITDGSGLKVFDRDRHPNTHLGPRHDKEGISVYGLLDHTRSLRGKETLKFWFMRPLQDLNEIALRHQTVSLLVRPECSSQLDSVHRHLGFVRNIRLVIDFEASVQEGRTVVKTGIDQKLDELKHVYDGLDDFLTQVARDISETLDPEVGQELVVVYFPQLGYLASLPSGTVQGIRSVSQELSGWDMMFSSDNRTYFKNQQIRELDGFIGDIYSYIIDREIEILQGLQQRTSEHAQALLDCEEKLANLDCFVPAESAVIGLTGRVFTRIQTVESVVKNQSAFMNDARQTFQAINDSTPQAMVVLDEFGKGTIPEDGVGLLGGVVKHFASRPASAQPWLLVATHFHGTVSGQYYLVGATVSVD